MSHQGRNPWRQPTSPMFASQLESPSGFSSYPYYNHASSFTSQGANYPSYTLSQPEQQLASNVWSQASGFGDPMREAMKETLLQAGMMTSQQVFGQSTEAVKQHVFDLKRYFAVNTGYVFKKLQLLIFPFAHSDWSLKHSVDGPLPPRIDVNAADLYIPMMAFVTFVLLLGIILGLSNRFDVELLGIKASSTLAWLVLEVLLMQCILWLQSMNASISILDLVAFCSYKYVGMMIMLIAEIFFGRLGYFIALLYFGSSCAFFLVRSFRIRLQPSRGETYSSKCLYALVLFALLQPLLMYWLSSSIPSSIEH